MTLMRSKTVPPPTQVLSESSFRNDLLVAKRRKFPAVTNCGIVRFGTEKRVSNDDDDDVNYAGSVAIAANCLKLQFLFFLHWKPCLCVSSEERVQPLCWPAFNHSSAGPGLTSAPQSLSFLFGSLC